MKDTTTIRLRPDRRAPRPQSQATEPEGASSAETPIYAELATEWLDRGRTLPATSSEPPPVQDDPQYDDGPPLDRTSG